MKIYNRFALTVTLTIVMLFISVPVFNHVFAATDPVCMSERTSIGVPACQSVDANALGFQIPSLSDILTFAIRAFFAIAGIAALFYMLIGAFGWVTSGGDKDSISAARERIQAAVVGMILIVAVLAIIWTLEQVIFKKRICLGLSCPVTLPGLIETGQTGSPQQQRFCCSCLKPDGTEGAAIDAFTMFCKPNDPNGDGEYTVVP